jgi:hypothetical protein
LISLSFGKAFLVLIGNIMKLIKNNLDMNDDLLQDLLSTFNLDKNLIQFLYSKGYTTKESIQTFLHPSFNQFL